MRQDAEIFFAELSRKSHRGSAERKNFLGSGGLIACYVNRE
jgi:hypothetical protein